MVRRFTAVEMELQKKVVFTDCPGWGVNGLNAHTLSAKLVYSILKNHALWGHSYEAWPKWLSSLYSFFGLMNIP